MIREVKDGATYTLTDRGQPVADIKPHRRARWRPAAEVNQVFARIGPDLAWADELVELREQGEVRDPWESDR